jgi:hypothetical protein
MGKGSYLLYYGAFLLFGCAAGQAGRPNLQGLAVAGASNSNAALTLVL